MTIYVGMTQDLEAAKKHLTEQNSGMYPDVEMGPYRNKEDAVNYIKFMKNRFPGSIEIDLPEFSIDCNHLNKWWVFSFEHSGNVH